MSTANAGIILLLRYYTTGTKIKKRLCTWLHLCKPLKSHQSITVPSALEIMIKDQFNSSIISPFTDLQWFYTSCSCWYTPKSQANRFPKGKGRRKKYVCLLTSLKKERTKWGARFFLSCVVNDVQMRADPCFNMAVHRQMVSCKIAQLSCKNRSTSREHVITY